MLHPAVRDGLLDQELAIAVQRLGDRAPSISRTGAWILIPIRTSHGLPAFIRLDGAGFDGAPFGVDVVDPDHQPLPIDAWPSGLAHSIHPVHNRPWVCIRGTAEYFTYPGHHMERWDTYRNAIRLPDLIDYLLQKVGQ